MSFTPFSEWGLAGGRALVVAASLLAITGQAQQPDGGVAPVVTSGPDARPPASAAPEASAPDAGQSAPAESASTPPAPEPTPPSSPPEQPPLVVTAPEAPPPAVGAPGDVPRRMKNRLLLLGEFGWNSMSGVGVIAGYHLLNHLTLEAGAGFSPVKLKFGLRARANLLQGEWTPFVSAGLAYGLGDPDTEALWLGGGAAFRYNLLRSPYAQLSAGIDFTGDDAVVFLANVGWSFLLSENVRVVRGTPTNQQNDLMHLAYKSGPIVAVAFGYAF